MFSHTYPFKAIALGLILSLMLQFGFDIGIVAFYNFNKNFVIEQLCVEKDLEENTCQGHCFLKQEQKKAENNAPILPENQRLLEAPLFLAESFLGISSPGAKDFDYSLVFNDKLCSGYGQLDLRPPIFV